MPKKEDSQQDIDIAVLKNDVGTLKETVGLIMTNHLPHIHDRLSKIENKLALWGGAIIILGIILPYFLDKFFLDK